MIKISKSPTADTRTCDVTKVTEEQLLDSSIQHIEDVRAGMEFFMYLMQRAGISHDETKITHLEDFYKDFKNNFDTQDWYEMHKRKERHHIDKPEGVRDDINLVDVLEHITDCVMAGMARSGSVYDLKIDDAVLQKAFKNTVELLKSNVEVDNE